MCHVALVFSDGASEQTVGVCDGTIGTVVTLTGSGFGEKPPKVWLSNEAMVRAKAEEFSRGVAPRLPMQIDDRILWSDAEADRRVHIVETSRTLAGRQTPLEVGANVDEAHHPFLRGRGDDHLGLALVGGQVTVIVGPTQLGVRHRSLTHVGSAHL